jgi:hypothetical protein
MGRVAKWSRLAAFGRQCSGSTSSHIEMVFELGRRERFGAALASASSTRPGCDDERKDHSSEDECGSHLFLHPAGARSPTGDR